MRTFVIVALTALLIGCTAVQTRRAARMAGKAVVAICETQAAQRIPGGLGGVSSAEWCAIAGNLALFVDAQLSEGQCKLN